MDNILTLAQQLGKAIAASPAGVAMKAAQESVRADGTTLKLMRDFQTQAQKIAHLEENNKPIEPPDKHKLEELENQLAANDRIKKLTEAQMEYMDLIRQVNESIQRELGEPDMAEA